MMKARYREFRKFGHGRIIAILHAPTSQQLLIGACIAGVVLGILL